MEQHPNNHYGLLLVAGNWVLCFVTMQAVNLVLATIVSLMAIVHYGLLIRKNLKDKK